MRILITGASGFIGQSLCKYWHQHELTLLSRNVTRAQNLLGEQHQYIESLSQLDNLNDFDAIVNLAGEAIADKPWSPKQRQKIEGSRWALTEQLFELIKHSETPPHTFLSGSAIGIYDYSDEPQDENSHFTQGHYPHLVCSKWEDIALQAQSPSTRVCLLRTAVVLGVNGGLLKRLAPVFKLGLGGPMGSGKQLMSWIHLEDQIRAMDFLLTQEQLAGAFNVCAPEVVNNQHLSKQLASYYHRPCWFKVPSFALKLGLGEMSEMILASQNIVPKNLLDAGFSFNHPSFDLALIDSLKTAQ
ncbi:TIGR01777 family protein [Alginatibacterium sediminis]|uniref:TIGR01777 family protein n=1 Tax=Alginatibacterium sediminis TaxID=2164068 RepID=A0A420EA14_9ALTE|nr:TIGR01777 family oxidoreductase [Alginatibacterium sediminis]RKF17501.1 TIGR01777 family protein [Alginatibacterium sediminis]